MEGILSIDVPFGIALVIAVIVGIILALSFLFDVWREVRELLDELREWWRARRD